MDTRDEIVGAARALAGRLGTGALSLRQFTGETGLSDNRVYAYFDCWADLCRAAGLEAGPSNRRLTDAEVFGAMRDAFVAAGGVGTLRAFSRHFRHSANLFRRRGMTWPAALVAFREWVRVHDPGFPYMHQLPESVAPSGLWPAGGSRALGELLGFRALLHAPVNEAGVVLLFGMVAADLGFAVETVAADFPDCEAKRRVTGGRPGWRWQRVRIEFEYRSRNFQAHGHDPAGCDLIVCWEHDWPDCPLEVVELRAAIAALGG